MHLEEAPLLTADLDHLLGAFRIVEREGKGHFEDGCDLDVMRSQHEVGCDDAEHRGDAIAGHGTIVGQCADDLDRVGRQVDFLTRLAQRCRHRVGIVGIDAPARKGDLPRVAAHRVGTLRQDQPRFGPIRHRDQDRSLDSSPWIIIAHVACERHRRVGACLEPRTQPLCERHACIAKNAPSLHSPGGWASSASAISASS